MVSENINRLLIAFKDAKIIYEWTPVRRVRELESENARLKDAERISEDAK